jgi:aminoglycoside phosphotransferase (APT) family kinase protein
MPETSPLVAIDIENLTRALAQQAPHWRHLSLSRLTSSDNAMFRLGDGLVLRMPRRSSAAVLPKKELDWLAHLQDLPLAVPRLHFRGQVEAGPVVEFGVLDWIEGQAATTDHISDWHDAARWLAACLTALHGKETVGAQRLDQLSGFRLRARAQKASRLTCSARSVGAIPAVFR